MTRTRTNSPRCPWRGEAEWAAGKLWDASRCREIHECKAKEPPKASRSRRVLLDAGWPGHAKVNPRGGRKRECWSRLRSSAAAFINEGADCFPVVNQLALPLKSGLAQPEGFLGTGVVQGPAQRYFEDFSKGQATGGGVFFGFRH